MKPTPRKRRAAPKAKKEEFVKKADLLNVFNEWANNANEGVFDLSARIMKLKTYEAIHVVPAC